MRKSLSVSIKRSKITPLTYMDLLLCLGNLLEYIYKKGKTVILTIFFNLQIFNLQLQMLNLQFSLLYF